jgi:hypothetical protein
MSRMFVIGILEGTLVLLSGFGSVVVCRFQPSGLSLETDFRSFLSLLSELFENLSRNKGATGNTHVLIEGPKEISYVTSFCIEVD